MKTETYKQLKNTIEYWAKDHYGLENAKFEKKDKANLKYKNCPSYYLKNTEGEFSINLTYWNHHSSERDGNETFTKNFNDRYMTVNIEKQLIGRVNNPNDDKDLKYENSSLITFDEETKTIFIKSTIRVNHVIVAYENNFFKYNEKSSDDLFELSYNNWLMKTMWHVFGVN